MTSGNLPRYAATRPAVIFAIAQPRRCPAEENSAYSAARLIGQIQFADGGEGEHVAIPHHDPDHAVGGLLLGTAPGGDRFEVAAAAGDRHGQSGTKSGEIDRLLRGMRVGQHVLGCGQSLGNLVLVHRH